MAPADPDLVAQDAPGAAVAADAHAAAADTAASATAPSEADADTDVAADADIDGDIDADADADADVDDHTAYTYAVDLQADEAVAAGAEHVELSAPASYFLENFIGAPVGSAVPAGTYDYEQGLWLADPDGRVVQLISITGALADLDINGDGLADSASSIEAIGITEDERAWLATRYSVGAELWHTEIHHFSVVDLNNMKGCPWCEGPPELPLETDDACSPQKRVRVSS